MTFKNVALTALTGIAFLSVAPVAFASANCQPVYGGGQTCTESGNLSINKLVQLPDGSTFVDNLGPNDAKFSPENLVTFKIIVTNNGKSTVTNVNVQDILPQYVSLNGGNLNNNIGDIAAGESKTITVNGKIANADNLPSNQTITCVVNQAIATGEGQTVQDNAQLCIEKQIPGVTVIPGKTFIPTETKGGKKIFEQPVITKTPPTGPEALALLGLLPAGIAGYFLRKKNS